MTIQHSSQGHKGTFVALDEATEAGLITYSLAGEKKMILDHTEVLDSYRGQHVGEKIVFAIADYARQHQISIIPLCPFARAVFQKNKKIQDVLST